MDCDIMDNFIGITGKEREERRNADQRASERCPALWEGIYKTGKDGPVYSAAADVNKYYLGICTMDLEGNVLEAGMRRFLLRFRVFPKLISLILAIRDCGADHLFHEKVGVEPTGDPFHSIVKLETKTRPFNPFINAGAITVASCIRGKDADEKFERFLEFTRRVCNNQEIALNEPVYPVRTGDRRPEPGACVLPEGVRHSGRGRGRVPGFLFPDVFRQCDGP